jgi:hypothetical protein
VKVHKVSVSIYRSIGPRYSDPIVVGVIVGVTFGV